MAQRSISIKASKKRTATKPKARLKNRLPRLAKAAKVEGLRVFDLGLVLYSEAWVLQKELVEKRADKEIPDTLLILEHPPIVTRGRKSQPPINTKTGNTKTAATKSTTLPVFEIERGGEDTLHAPGQIVGYPILLLSPTQRDLHQFMRRLEEILIRVLADFGLEADRREGYTGVWVGERKIASIGIACRKWITYHGFALNVNNDLSLFQSISPCGLDPKIMTSLEKELGCPVSMKAVKQRIVDRFSKEFGFAGE